MTSHLSKTIFEHSLADQLDPGKVVTKQAADETFKFFKQCNLFRWKDANNDCEDRANAICILLDEWSIPNFKGWVFSGYFFRRENGSLTNNWNYHVAAALPVKENDQLKYYVIDPATSDTLVAIEDWASNITDIPFSYHFIRHSAYYIFPSRKIDKDNWYKRNKRNYRWTVQGLSGINAVSSVGKAQLIFKKERIKKTELAFNKLKCDKPAFAR